MTSTPFNVGLRDGNRPSSRVLLPPGGGHTDIFGGNPEPPRGRRFVAPASAGGTLGMEPAIPMNGTETSVRNGQATPEAIPQEPSTVEPKQEAKLEITAPPEVAALPDNAAKPAPASSIAEVPKMEAPKRVRVPPGGFSSGLW